MTFTENDATKKTCPLSLASGSGAVCCISSACMAWRYTVPPKLEFTRTLSVARVAQLVDAIPADIDSAAFDVDRLMRDALHDRAVLSVLSSVTPDWVCSEGPDYDAEESCLYAKFSRAFDDKAVGYCGMAPIYLHRERNEA